MTLGTSQQAEAATAMGVVPWYARLGGPSVAGHRLDNFQPGRECEAGPY